MNYVLSLAMLFSPGCATDGAINLAPVQGWEAFASTWRIVGAVSAAEEQVKTAVYKATENMNFLTRGIARNRLISSQKPPKSIRMQLQNKMFTIHPDTFPALSMPISGEAVKREDRKFRVSLESGGGGLTLRQVSENQQGKRENIYRLREGGKSMEMEVVINSSNLPAEVQYKLQFTRVE